LETNRHYFLVGTFVLVTTIFVLLFTVWLTSASSGDYAKYRIRFAESVSGLSVGGTVKYRGVDVGSVESIEIDPRDTKLILVIIQVKKTTPIKYDTIASLKLQGITGVVFIELTGGSNVALDMPKESWGDDIPEIRAKSSPISAVVDRLPEVMDNISKTVEQINKIVSNENVASMSAILANTEVLVKNASVATADLNRSSEQLDSLMRDLKKTSRNAAALSEGLKDDPSKLIFPSSQKGIPAP